MPKGVINFDEFTCEINELKDNPACFRIDIVGCERKFIFKTTS